MKKHSSKGKLKNGCSISSCSNSREIKWELRPGGMLVQKRDHGEAAAASTGIMINIKVSHGSYHHQLSLPAQSTFGDLKISIAYETGLEPKEQRLLFQGKEKNDDECLHMVGVTDKSKVILFEDPASRERKIKELTINRGALKAWESVAKARADVNNLYEKIVALEETMRGGKKIAQKEFVILTELLMQQLLVLDSIDAVGEAKLQRRMEVRRIQSLVDTLDNLKAIKYSPFSEGSYLASVTTKWQTFETGFGSLNPPALQLSTTKVTQNWESFD